MGRTILPKKSEARYRINYQEFLDFSNFKKKNTCPTEENVCKYIGVGLTQSVSGSLLERGCITHIQWLFILFTLTTFFYFFFFFFTLEHFFTLLSTFSHWGLECEKMELECEKMELECKKMSRLDFWSVENFRRNVKKNFFFWKFS